MPAVASIPTQGMMPINAVSQVPMVVGGGSAQLQQTLIQQDVRPSILKILSGIALARSPCMWRQPGGGGTGNSRVEGALAPVECFM